MKKLIFIALAFVYFSSNSQTWHYPISPTQALGTTTGINIFTLPNPGAIRFIKVNADNTVTARTAAEILSDIGAQASGSYQTLDADLTTISGLTPTTDNFLVSVSSAWASRTPAQVKTTLSLDNVTNESKATMFANATFTGTFAVAAGSVSNSALANGAVANLSGTNTGDQTLSDATISTTDITTNNFTTSKHGFVPKGTNVGNFLKDDGTWAAAAGGGTVTAIGVTTANGVSGSSSGGTTPNLTITLAAITPTTIVATDMISAPTGTTSITPLKIPNGVLATNSIAGGIESDGLTMYNSTTAQDRGVIASIKFTSSTSTFAVPNSTAAFPLFATTEDAFNVTASTSYFFEGSYEITGMGATTRTTGHLFGGTATITSISYVAMIQTGTAEALGTTQSTKHCVAATSQVLNATAATAAEWVYVKGIVRINGAGTFIPQMIHSADPTGTILVAVNSWFRMYPIGTNTVLKSGLIN